MMNWGKPKEFRPVVVQGTQLRCVVCRHGIFWEHEIQLATPLMNFLDLEEWNRVAHCAVCERCGYVHMFIHRTQLGKKNRRRLQSQNEMPNISVKVFASLTGAAQRRAAPDLERWAS